MTPIGEKIHRLRREQGMTLEALAKKLGSSRHYVWRLENTSKNYSAKKIHDLARVLGVSADFLMEDAEETPQEQQIDSAFFSRYQHLPPEAKVQMRKILATFEGD